MNSFCTLFNSVYLSRGLAMHTSMACNCSDFHLYIFAFDDLCYETLIKLNLQSVTVISLKEFENERLLKIKDSRTPGEYCWTSTPSTILYCIETYQLANCTYIDSDLLFFADPAVLIDEMCENSVMISDHRYTPEYDNTAVYGRYCVQFMTFKNDSNGLKVLNWWNDACLEWCFNRAEDNKFGDQKYLDDWTTRFEGIHELKHLGGGVAPWNIQQYDVALINGKFTGTEKATGQQFRFIFYHYHHYKYCESNGCLLGYYNIELQVMRLIYSHYIKALEQADNQLKNIEPNHVFHEELEIPRLKKSIRRMFIFHFKKKFRYYYKRSYILQNG